ncbi:MAG: T9SS type A sorting domain-containing protein, partial [Bacteroidetes bacterium]|nr:T9SS type A sorting domain-containing protein [Bacteroidota bacterium]
VEIAPCNILVEVTPLTPQHCELYPVHPNPVRSSTVIRFSLSQACPLTLQVTDLLGRTVLRLIDGDIRTAGEHAMTVDAEGFPEGVYFIRLVAGDNTRIRRMLKLR